MPAESDAAELARWQDVAYLRDGSASQQRAYADLCALEIPAALHGFDAVLIGSVPLGLDLPGSDLDIACCAADLDHLAGVLVAAYGGRPGYAERRTEASGGPALVVEFAGASFGVQVFAQALPVLRQRGYRHLLVEDRLLRLAGPDAAAALRALKLAGLKTEPAFAQYFGLSGDPYATLVEMSDWPAARLAAWVADRQAMTDAQPMADARGQWEERYRAGTTPWDTGIVPPEVVALVESGRVPRGWALDVGCGSGVSSRYLAGQGWRVVGVDLALSALRRAHAAEAAVPAHFCLADAARLPLRPLAATLALDVGCCHAVPPQQRPHYIAGLAALLQGGAYFLLYAFEPQSPPADGPAGLDPADLARFAPAFRLVWARHGQDRSRPSAWYLLQRSAVPAQLLPAIG